ncbi:ChaB-like protein [Spodoptera exempta nucleopolyhedrovirus]|uniref:ChaB-like protein n=1 Tax=Spodoptera exempta nucleopolyhedrovirus TaxID=1242863 RepID=A0A410S7T7_9ABAC|nr:ChaB-like protein [Spodoptera exempta nucleopolyhedrovirus]QAT90386.1 ChaB-like protein [Spodoptera exempta nucleopolyhedrovirus]
MFHLNEAFYHEEMPARAKRLFVKTFKKYHKLDGGDEDVALHMAKQAVDREYIKLNNRWIPKTAAEEIVRHDLDEDSLSEDENLQQQNTFRQRLAAPPLDDEQFSVSESGTDDEDYPRKTSRSVIGGGSGRITEDEEDYSDDEELDRGRRSTSVQNVRRARMINAKHRAGNNKQLLFK